MDTKMTEAVMTTDYDDFRKNILKANVKKNKFKVSNSYGIKDAYRWIKKNKLFGNEIPTESEFRIIVNTVNKALQDSFLNGKDITFPYNMGVLELRKIQSKVYFEDGKIKTNMPVDWKRTLQYWYEDEDAKKQKKLLRTEVSEKFKIYYRKTRARFNNKIYVGFSPTRDVKLKLKNKISKGGVDALLKGRRYEFYKY